MSLSRLWLAVLAGKVAQGAARRTGRGGTALPGLVAERIEPNFISKFTKQLGDVALISGTNGKTTTARMIAEIAKRDGRLVIHNRAGSNLMRGIGAALVDAAGATGRLPQGSLGVFEIDEATLPEAVRVMQPKFLLINNLMRDQLDRYGEIESVRGRWVTALASLPPTTTLFLNADDPSVATLSAYATGAVRFFGIDDTTLSISDTDSAEQPVDALWDPDSGEDYKFTHRFFSHLGHWTCPRGGLHRPDPDVGAHRISQSHAIGDDVSTISFEVSAFGEKQHVNLPLDGLYNVYNALAAVGLTRGLGIEFSVILPAIAEMRPVFGRQERLVVQGHTVRILLGKNPAGLSAALETLRRGGAQHHLLVLLNDRIADGIDTSWIWDTDWESVSSHTASVAVGGTRAADMALRLQYAGLPEPSIVVSNIDSAVKQTFDWIPAGAPLIVLPTYTALLEARKLLGRMAGATRIWDGA